MNINLPFLSASTVETVLIAGFWVEDSEISSNQIIDSFILESEVF